MNTSEGRRRTRAEALAEVLNTVRTIRPPARKPQGWVTEFNRGVESIARLLENQIAQAEGRVPWRRKRGPGSA